MEKNQLIVNGALGTLILFFLALLFLPPFISNDPYEIFVGKVLSTEYLYARSARSLGASGCFAKVRLDLDKKELNVPIPKNSQVHSGDSVKIKITQRLFGLYNDYTILELEE